MEKNLLNWMETGISNDFVFYYVMRDNPDICLELLQIIFPEMGISRVELVETQKVFDEAYDAHGVRLDVYTEDSDNRAYDIEMQATNKGNLRKRSRFNQSMMDMNQLSKSMDYDLLKQSFVIFICDFDLFGQGRYVYTFENRCVEDIELGLNDEITKVFINARGTVGEVSDNLKSFLKMVTEKTATDDFTRKIQEAIDFIHMDKEARAAYMTLEMKIIEECKEAKKEARAEGLAEGRAEGQAIMIQLIEKMNSDGLTSEIVKLSDRTFLQKMLVKYDLK